MISNLPTVLAPSPGGGGVGDLVVAILIIILILLAIYKMCTVWQNVLNFKQVTSIGEGRHNIR